MQEAWGTPGTTGRTMGDDKGSGRTGEATRGAEDRGDSDGRPAGPGTMRGAGGQ